MSSQAVRRIVAIANQLRQERPNQYGVKGAKPGSGNYVKDGWKNAVKTATELYYRETGKTPKQKKPRVTSQVKGDPRMDALYRGWLIALRQLKEKYYKAGLRMVAPAKIKVSQSQRQRLPPTILSYTQAKTNIPLPKQTNIVQESRKRKGEELQHLGKRTRPTLLPHRQVPAFSFGTPNPASLDEMSLPSGPVEFGTQSLADELRQVLEEEGEMEEDLGEETKDEEDL